MLGSKNGYKPDKFSEKDFLADEFTGRVEIEEDEQNKETEEETCLKQVKQMIPSLIVHLQEFADKNNLVFEVQHEYAKLLEVSLRDISRDDEAEVYVYVDHDYRSKINIRIGYGYVDPSWAPPIHRFDVVNKKIKIDKNTLPTLIKICQENIQQALRMSR